MTFNLICESLKLKNTPDWGIINADASRVEEFIDFILEHQNVDFSIKYEFVELILASINAALVEEKYSWHLLIKLCKYIKPIIHDHKYYPQIDYWISIKSRDGFPVGYLLESIKELFI